MTRLGWAGRKPAPRLFLVWLTFILTAPAAGTEPATITGRVFDVYHRPVPFARVGPIERRGDRIVPGTPFAIVDEGGMFRLSLPPGRYVIAVMPPPQPLDFATVFPLYFPDAVDVNRAETIVLSPGEVRPFVYFLLLDTESHTVEGRVSGTRKPAAVSLFARTGYTGALRTVQSDAQGRFRFDHVPAGSYELTAAGHGRALVDVSAPEVRGIQIPGR